MKCGARVAMGVAGGYFLGRTKKMKLAIMLGAVAAGRQVGGPGEVLGSAGKLLGKSPELSALTDQVRGRLLDAGKGAAMAVATRQVESLTDRVGRRVESLGDLGAGKRPDKQADDRGLDEYDDYEDVDSANGTERTDEPSAKEEPGDDKPPRRSPGRPRRNLSSDGASETSSSSKEGSARAAAPRRAPRAPSGASSGGATKRAAGTAKRAASGSATATRRTASKPASQRRTTRATRGEDSDA